MLELIFLAIILKMLKYSAVAHECKLLCLGTCVD